MPGAGAVKKRLTAGRQKPDPSARFAFDAIYEKLYAAYGPQHWWPVTASDPDDSAFEVMTGAVLTQNTAWTNVERALANLRRANALTPDAMVKSPHRRLAAWLKPSGYFNVKAKRLKALSRWLLSQGGIRKLAALPTSDLRAALLGVHGVGPETADDIVLYAFHRPVFVIDAYTRRVFSRLGLIKAQESYANLQHLFENKLKPNAAMFNEYHALLVKHGKDICRKQPHCTVCCLRVGCRFAGQALY